MPGGVSLLIEPCPGLWRHEKLLGHGRNLLIVHSLPDSGGEVPGGQIAHQAMNRLRQIRHEEFFGEFGRQRAGPQCPGHVAQLECWTDGRYKQVVGLLVGLYLCQLISMGTNDRWKIRYETWKGFFRLGVKPGPEYKNDHHREGEANSR